MSARDALARGVTWTLGSLPVDALARRRWSKPLRVIDYHEINDADAFERQVEMISNRYQPVSEHDVRSMVAGDRELADLSVWVTFDDGDPSVIDAALPVLRRFGVPATFYVCPGLIEDQVPPWWEIVEVAGTAGHGAEVGGRVRQGADLVKALKQSPDADRRRVVAELVDVAVAELGEAPRAVTLEQLERWVDAGNTVGNHTWDHPCLDRCSPEEQEVQISKAHEWLVGFGGGAVPTFAYPNGDHTDHAESVLDRLGYDVALLSDHRLVDPSAPPLQMSRLRLDASAPAPRSKAVLSGVHSAGYDAALRRRLTGPALRST